MVQTNNVNTSSFCIEFTNDGYEVQYSSPVYSAYGYNSSTTKNTYNQIVYSSIENCTCLTLSLAQFFPTSQIFLRNPSSTNSCIVAYMSILPLPLNYNITYCNMPSQIGFSSSLIEPFSEISNDTGSGQPVDGSGVPVLMTNLLQSQQQGQMQNFFKFGPSVENNYSKSYSYKGYSCEIVYNGSCFLGYIHTKPKIINFKKDDYNNMYNNNTYIPTCGFTYYNYGFGFDDSKYDITIIVGENSSYEELIELNMDRFKLQKKMYGDINRIFKSQKHVENELNKIVDSFLNN